MIYCALNPHSVNYRAFKCINQQEIFRRKRGLENEAGFNRIQLNPVKPGPDTRLTVRDRYRLPGLQAFATARDDAVALIDVADDFNKTTQPAAPGATGT